MKKFLSLGLSFVMFVTIVSSAFAANEAEVPAGAESPTGVYMVNENNNDFTGNVDLLLTNEANTEENQDEVAIGSEQVRTLFSQTINSNGQKVQDVALINIRSHVKNASLAKRLLNICKECGKECCQECGKECCQECGKECSQECGKECSQECGELCKDCCLSPFEGVIKKAKAKVEDIKEKMLMCAVRILLLRVLWCIRLLLLRDNIKSRKSN